MNIAVVIGRNIRSVRTARGLTLKHLADLISDESGQAISESLVGSWQRAERRISAEYLLLAAQVMRCSVLQLFGLPETLDDADYVSDHERDIVLYALNQWAGDWHPLLQLVGLYMASSPEIRKEYVNGALRIFKDAYDHGMVVNVPYDIRTQYIEKRRDELK